MTSDPTPPPPRPERPIGAIGAVTLSLSVLGVFLGALHLLALREAAVHGVPLDEALDRVQAARPSLALAQAMGLLVALAAGLLLYRPRLPLRASLRLRSVGPLPLALCVVAGFALQFPLAELGNVLHGLWPMDLEQQRALARLLEIHGPRDALEVAMLVLVIAPFGEELLFRGLLLPGLRPRLGAAGAVLATALLFGAVHVEPVSAALAAVVGLLLGAVALRAGSTLPAIALHLGFNAAPVLLPRQLVRIEGFNTIEEGTLHLPLGLVLAALAVAAGTLLSFHRLEGEGAR